MQVQVHVHVHVHTHCMARARHAHRMLHAHRTPHVARTPQAVYEFWYKDLCDVYLEAIKPVMQLDSSVAGSDNAKRKHATQTVPHRRIYSPSPTPSPQPIPSPQPSPVTLAL